MLQLPKTEKNLLRMIF